jgi:hypothetical protein
MNDSKQLKNCSTNELNALAQIVRLAADLHEKRLLPDSTSLTDALIETITLMETAADMIATFGEHDAANN